jgi:hypothetical protein
VLFIVPSVTTATLFPENKMGYSSVEKLTVALSEESKI